MKRRFNYTGRQRIPRENIEIALIKDPQGKNTSFDAKINLDGLVLPPKEAVYVEAYRRYELKRFNFGTVDNICSPSDTSLTDLSNTENLKFRVLVIDNSGKAGRILAHADRITTQIVPDIKAILPADFKDIGQQIWLVEFTGEENSPRIVINSKIPNIQSLAKSDPRFIMDVYPSALREVLIHMIFVAGIDSISDPSIDWCRDWLQFSKLLIAEDPPKERYKLEEYNDSEIKGDWLEWVDKVVAEFCTTRREWQDYIGATEDGG